MTKPANPLLPHWTDPGLPDPVASAPAPDEIAARASLAAMAEQLRRIGVAQTVRSLLRRHVTDPALRQMLLAAPGFAPWQDPDGLRWPRRQRRSADGLLYRLEITDGGPAPHAEHAASRLRQRLFLQDAELADAFPERHCLSIACAQRDVLVQLRADGEHGLADDVAAIMTALPASFSAPAAQRATA